MALRQEFAGLTVRSNPNHAVSDQAIRLTRETLAISGVLEAEVRDCKLIALGVTQAGRVQVQNCSIAYTEPDKLVDELTFKNCSIGSLQECTGIDRMRLSNCNLEQPARLFGRDVAIDRCTFRGELSAGDFASGVVVDGPNPTRRMSIVSSRFLGRNDPTGLPLGGRIWTRIPVDGRVVQIKAGNAIEVLAGSDQFGSFVSRLEEGWPLKVSGKTGYRFGQCVRIEGKADGGLVLGYTMSGALEIGDTLLIPAIRHLEVRDCEFERSRDDWPDTPFLDWQETVAGSRLLRMKLRSDFASRPAWLPGMPIRIDCSVEKAYAGPDKGCYLSIEAEDPARTAFALTIDLSVVGKHHAGAEGSDIKPGDTLLVARQPSLRLPKDLYFEGATAMIVPRPGAVPAVPRGTDEEAAVVMLEIEVVNPFDKAAL